MNAGQMGAPGSFSKYAVSALNQVPFSGNDPTAIKTGIMRPMYAYDWRRGCSGDNAQRHECGPGRE